MKKILASLLPALVMLARLVSPALPLVAMDMAMPKTDFKIYYMSCDEDGGWLWESQKVPLGAGLSADEKACAVLSRLLEKAACVPNGAEVTGAAVEGGLLRLNMSEAAFNAGGSEAERVLAAQLLRTALSLPGVEKVTLMRDNRPAPLAEGTLILEENQWESYYGD